MTATAAPNAAPAPTQPGRNVARELARAAFGPVICAVALTELLSAWVATGGARTLSRARLQVTLSPFGDDVVLRDPAPFETSSSVPLTLTFRQGGTVTIDATVTAPGTP